MSMTRERLRLELARARRSFGWLTLLYACAAIAAVAMLSRQVFISPVGDYRRVDVALDRAAGVVAGKTGVRISGVEVGVVESKRLVDGRPRLTLALDGDVGLVHRDARVRLTAITPLQDMVLELDRGTPASGDLAERGLIPATHTGVSVELADVLDSFVPDQRTRLAALLRELGAGLPDGGVRLRSAFREVVPLMRSATEVTRELAAQRRELARGVHQFAELTGVLARRDRQLAALVRDGSATLGTLARNDRPLDATLRALPATLRALDRGLARVAGAVDEVDPALRALRPTARAMRAGLPALEAFARDARPALRALSPTARELAPLTARLRGVAGALGAASRELEPQVPVLDAFTATTAACLDPLAAFFHRFVSATKLGSDKGRWWRNQLVVGPDSMGGPDPTERRIDACSDGRRSR